MMMPHHITQPFSMSNITRSIYRAGYNNNKGVEEVYFYNTTVQVK
jgi:hypothetical protein